MIVGGRCECRGHGVVVGGGGTERVILNFDSMDSAADPRISERGLRQCPPESNCR